MLAVLSAPAPASEIRYSAPWAPAEPALPDSDAPEDLDFLLLSNGGPLRAATASWGELCRDSVAGPLAEACAAKVRPRPWRISFDLGAYPLGRPRPAFRPFERFENGWGSVRVDPELGSRWAGLPAVIGVRLGYPVTRNSYLGFRIGLRRDLRAWKEDALGLNLPLSDAEVDLNEPSLGFFRAEGEHWAFTAGRFPVHWSPSPEYGLALSRSVPYHNGAELALKMPWLRYRFLASSLNPWLEGTPVGDSSGTDYPPGSEEWRQRHYPGDRGAGIFHKRVYDARIKTLLAHRLEADFGPVSLGLTETQVIGGKTPDLRDAGPFVFFHNDFKEGYANGALSLEASWRLPGGAALFGEYYMDDVRYDGTEGDGGTPSLGGWMLGARHAFSARGWRFGHSLHAIRTDPYLYGYLQPLNTAASRVILASNDQRDGDPVFVDKYVIDFPLGYVRGGDAFDFRYRIEARRGERFRAAFSAGALAQGGTDLYTPYETYYSASHDSPSGTAERELRLGLEGEWGFAAGPSVNLGAAWRRIRNEGHRKGEERDEARFSCGAAWAFPR